MLNILRIGPAVAKILGKHQKCILQNGNVQPSFNFLGALKI